MKVVWLCHFANKEIKDFFNTPNVRELSPWINNLIELFQDRKDIEVHIVSPNIFTNRPINIKKNNIHFHFYPFRPSFIPKRLYNHFDLDARTNFIYIKKKIFKIIKQVDPALIHLHGAENPIYAAGILSLIKSYPTIVTIQGFIRNSTENDFVTDKRKEIEQKIISKSRHIGVRTDEMSRIVLKINLKVCLHFNNYPVTIPKYVKDYNVKSTYDIIFFARVCKDKGIEDLMRALALVKKVKPGVFLNVVGSSDKYYMKHLINLTKELKINENMKFLDFMETQQDIYKIAVNARICVLPTYHDTVPGTIVESMYMKLPVIAYNVGGIPDLNNDGEIVVIVEKNNIIKLSEKIIYLLNNKDKRISIAERAYSYAQENYNNSVAVKEIINTYYEVLSTSD